MKRHTAALTRATLGAALLLAPALASANHPVLVEGELDFDGDGVVGLAEDNDGDAVFGTITRALGAAPAIGQNGTVVIVTSGRFPEVVTITNQVTLEAAPGVDVQLDAFLVPADTRLNEFPAAAADPFALQGAPGIIIDSPADRHVIIRNIGIVNWTDGIQIRGTSNVLLENVRSEHNINSGVNVMGTATVAITNSQITANGFRLNPRTGNFPSANAPQPGAGLSLAGGTVTAVKGTSITGNFVAGIMTGVGARLSLTDSLVFGNQRVMQLGLPMPSAPAPMMDMMMMSDDQAMSMMDQGPVTMSDDMAPAPSMDGDDSSSTGDDSSDDSASTPMAETDGSAASGSGSSSAATSPLAAFLLRLFSN